MRCGHCLRGEPENKEMSHTHINNFLRQIDSISCITFTGGEPTLPSGLKVIKYFLEACRVFKVELGSFYIVTNAKVWRPEFPKIIQKYYDYIDDHEMSGISISGDQYHERENNFQTRYKNRLREELELLGVSIKVSTRKSIDYDSIINEGRGAQYGSNRFTKVPIIVIESEDDGEVDVRLTEGELYLNCEGNVINGCDWSYESQRKPDHILCKASDNLKEAVLEQADNNFCLC
jgi:organic radical activating enzyme